MGKYSTNLFARASFCEGVARLIDVGNAMNEYNRSESAEEADQLAILCDWAQVGEDMREGFRLERDLPSTENPAYVGSAS
jgi:hypothetical protein